MPGELRIGWQQCMAEITWTDIGHANDVERRYHISQQEVTVPVK